MGGNDDIAYHRSSRSFNTSVLIFAGYTSNRNWTARYMPKSTNTKEHLEG